MSMQADYFCPDETPDFRDPTPEEMMENAPPEERMLAKVELALSLLGGLLSQEDDEKRGDALCAMRLLAEVEAYFKQAIADRDRDYGHDDPESDPFSDE